MLYCYIILHYKKKMHMCVTKQSKKILILYPVFSCSNIVGYPHWCTFSMYPLPRDLILFFFPAGNIPRVPIAGRPQWGVASEVPWEPAAELTRRLYHPYLHRQGHRSAAQRSLRIGTCYVINSLLPSGALGWHRSGSILAQGMACCLMAGKKPLPEPMLIQIYVTIYMV